MFDHYTNGPSARLREKYYPNFNKIFQQGIWQFLVFLLKRPGRRLAFRLIIRDGKFEIGLGMVADRANLRSEFANHDVPAVAAFPHRHLF